MTKPLDTACPWCGEELYDPFTGRDVVTQDGYDLALEAHVEECDAYLAENDESRGLDAEDERRFESARDR